MTIICQAKGLWRNLILLKYIEFRLRHLYISGLKLITATLIIEMKAFSDAENIFFHMRYHVSIVTNYDYKMYLSEFFLTCIYEKICNWWGQSWASSLGRLSSSSLLCTRDPLDNPYTSSVWIPADQDPTPFWWHLWLLRPNSANQKSRIYTKAIKTVPRDIRNSTSRNLKRSGQSNLDIRTHSSPNWNREKGRDLPQAYNKNPYTHWKIQKATRPNKTATAIVDF